MRLFGSRVDDTLRGGDIDLLITPRIAPDDEFGSESGLKNALQDRIGEQRIDVLVSRPDRPHSPIEQIAHAAGMVLPTAERRISRSLFRSSRQRTSTMSREATRPLLSEAIAEAAVASKLRRLMDQLAQHSPSTTDGVSALDWDESIRTDSLLLA